MKNLTLVIISLIVGIFVGVNRGYYFTQDLSMTAVEDVLDQAYSGVQASYSGNVAQNMLSEFNANLKENIAIKKQELANDLKKSLNEYLKKKIDELF